MRTPAGTFCQHYYEDFNRGRQTQVCRLVRESAHSLPWAPDLCASCPVPAIMRATSSRDLRIEAVVRKRLGLFRRVSVSAYCRQHLAEVRDPLAGCPKCRLERGDTT